MNRGNARNHASRAPHNNNMSSRFSRAIAFKILTVLACGAAPAHALEGMSLELGKADGANVQMARLGFQFGSWKTDRIRAGNWHLGGYLELALGYWRDNKAIGNEHDELYDLGFTPVMRFQPDGLKGPYIEAGLGVHLLSHASIGPRRLATTFQFGNHAAIGYRFGATGAYDISYRFQHLSNAGIKRPNPGINFHQVRLQHTF
jgi:lipid A 3-O-deacylase